MRKFRWGGMRRRKRLRGCLLTWLRTMRLLLLDRFIPWMAGRRRGGWRAGDLGGQSRLLGSVDRSAEVLSHPTRVQVLVLVGMVRLRNQDGFAILIAALT